jgi:hypothetical protein
MTHRIARIAAVTATAAALAAATAAPASAGGNGYEWYKSGSCTARSGTLKGSLSNYDWYNTVPSAQKYHHSETRAYGAWRASHIRYDGTIWPLVPTSLASGHVYDGTQIFLNPFPDHTVTFYWYNTLTGETASCLKRL